MRNGLGIEPATGTDGCEGYSVTQVSRLLGIAEPTVRAKIKQRPYTIHPSSNGQLLDAVEVNDERQKMLALLGADEPTVAPDSSGLLAENDQLHARVSLLESKLRLVVAAQAGARAAEEAYMEALLLDVPSS